MAVQVPLTPRVRGEQSMKPCSLFLDVFEKDQDVVRLDFHAKGFSQSYPWNFK